MMGQASHNTFPSLIEQQFPFGTLLKRFTVAVAKGQWHNTTL